jgi:hypothetical protein
MAKQTGALKYKGTLNGITHYKLKGVHVARAQSGFTKEAIRNNPRMYKIRENNSEFGNTSTVKKIFKNSLRPFFGSYKDGTLHTRMMSLFMQVKQCDATSDRGQRRVAIGLQTVEGTQLLKQFDFTPHTLDLRYSVYDAAGFSFTVNSPGLPELSYKNGATHLEVTLGIVVLDFDKLEAKLFASVPIMIAKEAPLTDFSLTPAEAPFGDGVRIAVLMHRYLQELNGKLYPLKDKVVYGLKVLEVGE